jgi:hypothetical protein
VIIDNPNVVSLAINPFEDHSPLVINDLDIDWAGRSFAPFKANPPLVIDADAVLSLPVTIEGFKPIAPKRA